MPEMWWLWLVYPGMPVLLAGTYLLRALAARRRRVRLWEESARALCETVEVKGRSQVTARSGPNEVRIISAQAGGKEVLVEMKVPGDFSAMRLSTLSGYVDSRIETGDASFDKQLAIEGPVRPVAARLDAAMRRQLLNAVARTGYLQIGNGMLAAKLPEESLPHVLPILLDIGRRLAGPVDVDRQITGNIRHDPVPGVRLSNLRHLVRLDDPENLAVLRDACSDESPEIRLQAAIKLGEEGHGVLRDLAESLADDALSARAIAHLGRALPLDNLKDILSRALHKKLVQTARACLEELGQRRSAAVDVLAQVMEKERGELATTAALALGMSGEASAEPALLQALQREDDDLRKAALAALGRVGTAVAVPALKEAAERSWLDISLRRAAHQAIAGIQSRLEGASPGQLSLAGAEGGQLSLAPDDMGQLSLAPHATLEPAEAIDRPPEQSGSRHSI